MEETSVGAEFVLMGPIQLVDIEVDLFPHIFYSYSQCLMTVLYIYIYIYICVYIYIHTQIYI